MQLTRAQGGPAQGGHRPVASRDWMSLGALAVAAGTIGVLTSVLVIGTDHAVRSAGQVGLCLSTAAAAMVLLWHAGRKDAWLGTRLFAAGISVSAGIQGFGLLGHRSSDSPMSRPVFIAAVGV